MPPDIVNIRPQNGHMVKVTNIATCINWDFAPKKTETIDRPSRFGSCFGSSRSQAD